MKKLFLTLLLTTSVCIQAQNISMLENNPEWVYYTHKKNLFAGSAQDDGSDIYKEKKYFTRFYLGEIENIMGIEYYKLCYDIIDIKDNGDFEIEEEHKYITGIREDKGRIYANWQSFPKPGPTIQTCYTITDEGECILYDFNLAQGYKQEYTIFVETKPWSPREFPEWCVENTSEEILYDGSVRKLLQLSTNLSMEKIIWIEGIGNISDYFYHAMKYDIIGGEATTEDGIRIERYLSSYSQNGHIVYKNNDNVDETGVYNTKEHQLPKIHTRFNLQGCKIMKTPSNGIYIENGRKVIK